MAMAARRTMIGAVLLTAAAGGYTTPCVAQADGAGTQLTLDERFALVAKRVPEFGGAYLGKDQRTLWVYVTAQRPGMVAELRRALRQALPGVEVPATIRLRKGDFTFDQLKRWKDSARGVLATPGVTMTDIDDATNRLTIGVSTQQPRSRVVQELGEREIPPAAWRIKEVKPAKPNSSLQNTSRPVMGGLQIARTISTTQEEMCSYGFTTFRDGILGFVTASHCTLKQGGDEGTLFFQNSSGTFPSVQIGVETVDPVYRTGLPGCPPFHRCRYSDSA